MLNENSLQIYCPICLDIPLITYKVNKFELYIILNCKNEHQQNFKIKNFEYNEKCELCFSLIENKKYEYNLLNNQYNCLNCIKRNKVNLSNKYFKKIDSENENIILEKYKTFLNSFNLYDEPSYIKSFYGIFSIIFNDLLNLNNLKLYNEQLNANINLILNLNWNIIFTSEDNFQILLINEEPFILFDKFYNLDFRNYYNSVGLLKLSKLLSIYKKYNINPVNDIGLFKNEINLEIKMNEMKVETIYNNIINYEKIINLNKEMIETKYNMNLSKIENIIRNYFHKNEIFLSNFILKRCFIKLIIDSLYSVYYSILEDIQPNYDSLFYFYKRLYNVHEKIDNENLKKKIEDVLSQLKNILFIRLKDDKKNLIKNDFSENNKYEFNENKIKEIKSICTQIEKEMKDKKCEYNSYDYNYIILKFTLNFLNYVRESSNFFIHILLEKISKHFYFSDFENKITLSELISSIFNGQVIKKKIDIEQLIIYFKFENSQLSRIDSIMEEFENLLLTDKIYKTQNNINEQYLYYKNEFLIEENKIQLYKKHYENILNLLITENQLGKKISKIINYESFFINEITNQLNKINEMIDKITEKKKNIIDKTNKILSLNILNEKLKIIKREIKSNKVKILSINDLFIEWKEKEIQKINKYLKGNIFLEVNKHLKLFNLESLIQFLFNFSKKNNIEIYFYEEEPDLNLNLFLYKNQINPHLCNLNYIEK